MVPQGSFLSMPYMMHNQVPSSTTLEFRDHDGRILPLLDPSLSFADGRKLKHGAVSGTSYSSCLWFFFLRKKKQRFLSQIKLCIVICGHTTLGIHTFTYLHLVNRDIFLVFISCIHIFRIHSHTFKAHFDKRNHVLLVQITYYNNRSWFMKCENFNLQKQERIS